jgi:hypothetical protein
MNGWAVPVLVRLAMHSLAGSATYARRPVHVA